MIKRTTEDSVYLKQKEIECNEYKQRVAIEEDKVYIYI